MRKAWSLHAHKFMKPLAPPPPADPANGRTDRHGRPRRDASAICLLVWVCVFVRQSIYPTNNHSTSPTTSPPPPLPDIHAERVKPCLTRVWRYTREHPCLCASLWLWKPSYALKDRACRSVHQWFIEMFSRYAWIYAWVAFGTKIQCHILFFVIKRKKSEDYYKNDI